MTQLQFRIMFREIAIVLAVIGFSLTNSWLQFIFAGYGLWNIFRMITHVINQIKR